MTTTTAWPARDSALDTHHEESRAAQWQADKWLMSGSFLMGTGVLGPVGLPLFLNGVRLQMAAARRGLSVRPKIVTLIGYLVFIDAAINSFGWSLDMVANHSLVGRIIMMGWGALFDNGYFWHYNELFIGGAGAPGEKSWEIACLPIVFCMRMAASIAFLQMKRWGTSGSSLPAGSVW